MRACRPANVLLMWRAGCPGGWRWRCRACRMMVSVKILREGCRPTAGGRISSVRDSASRHAVVDQDVMVRPRSRAWAGRFLPGGEGCVLADTSP